MDLRALDLQKLKNTDQISNSLDPGQNYEQGTLCNHISHSKPDFGYLNIRTDDPIIYGPRALDLQHLKIPEHTLNSLDPGTSSGQGTLCNHISHSKPDFGSLDI